MRGLLCRMKGDWPANPLCYADQRSWSRTSFDPRGTVFLGWVRERMSNIEHIRKMSTAGDVEEKAAHLVSICIIVNSIDSTLFYHGIPL